MSSEAMSDLVFAYDSVAMRTDTAWPSLSVGKESVFLTSPMLDMLEEACAKARQVNALRAAHMPKGQGDTVATAHAQDKAWKGRVRLTSRTLAVLHDVAKERNRQDEKWGKQDHKPGNWLMILGEEFGEACEAGCRLTFSDCDKDTAVADFRMELVQVAAVAVAMIECIDNGREG